MKRSAAAIAGMLLVAPLVFMGGAANAKSKLVREAVVATLGPTGAVQKAVVSQLLHLEAVEGSDSELRVPNVEDLDSYRNLSGFRGPSGEGDDFVWRTDGVRDTRALGRFNGDMPLNVAVRYLLDGSPVTADEIKRGDGHVRIEIDLENVTGEPQTLEHKAVTSPFLTSVVNQYIPMEYVVRVEFPMDRWRDVGGEGVKVSVDGEKEIASSSGVLSPPLTDARKTLVFEGRSDDVLTPRIQIFAIPGLSQDFVDALQTQFEALQALYGGVGSVNENLTKIYDGTSELVEGVEEMLAGVGRSDESTKKPVIDLDDEGLPTTLMGTIGFLANALNDDVLPPLGERDPETGEGVVEKDELGKTTTLLGGLQSQKDTYDDDLIPAVEDAIDGVKDFISQVSDGGDQLIDGLEQVQDGLEALLGGLQTGDPNDPGLKEGLEQVAGGLTALIAQLDTTFKGGMQQVSDGLVALITQLDTLFRGGLQQVSGGLSDLTALILASFKPGLEGVDAGLDALLPGVTGDFRQGLVDLQTGILGTQAAFGGLDPGLNAALGALATGAGDLLTALGDTGDPPTTIIGGLEAMSAGLTQLLAGLGDTGDPPTTIVGALEAMSAGMAQLLAGLGDNGDPPTTIIGGLEAMNAGMTQLLAGLGDDGVPTPTTVIGGLVLMNAGMGQLLAGLGDTGDGANPTTVIGGLLAMSAGMDQIVPGTEELVDGVLGGLDQLKDGFSNPEFTKEQDALDGKTPKEYFTECPGCFDPDHEAFDPATADPDFQPSLLEVFTLFSEGIDAALPQLHSFDESSPGLIDGLQQIAGGLDTLASQLHTFDPDNPGLVDGMELVRGGLQQVNQGLFALNELGVRTMRGQIGDEGDKIGRDQATLTGAAGEVAKTSALGSEADVVSATYVFDLPAQQTAANDNARRGALMSVALAGAVLLTRRMRLIAT